MSGFVIDENGPTDAIGYFAESDHIYHVQLAKAFTLCDHYYCPEIGPTLPNRFNSWTGTSGWNYLSPTETSDSLPFNNPSLTAAPPILSWETMPDGFGCRRAAVEVLFRRGRLNPISDRRLQSADLLQAVLGKPRS